jgi:hypothetical protein
VVAALFNPPTDQNAGNPARGLPSAARILGVQLHVLSASAERDFDAVFATLVQLRAGGLVIAADAMLFTRSAQLAALTLRHRLPAISPDRVFVAAGGLMSYGNNAGGSSRLAAGVLFGRILKGVKPAYLPVHQVNKLCLVINLKTAKALGLTIPETLLATADEVADVRVGSRAADWGQRPGGRSTPDSGPRRRPGWLPARATCGHRPHPKFIAASPVPAARGLTISAASCPRDNPPW